MAFANKPFHQLLQDIQREAFYRAIQQMLQPRQPYTGNDPLQRQNPVNRDPNRSYPDLFTSWNQYRPPVSTFAPTSGSRAAGNPPAMGQRKR